MAFVYGHRYIQEREQLAAGPWLRGTRPLESPEILSILVRPQFQEEYLAPFSMVQGRFSAALSIQAVSGVYTLSGQDATLSTGFFGNILSAQSGSYLLTGGAVVLTRAGGLWVAVGNDTTSWTQRLDSGNGLWVDYAAQNTTWVDS